MNTLPLSLISVNPNGTPVLIMSKERLDALPKKVQKGINVNSYLNYLESNFNKEQK